MDLAEESVMKYLWASWDCPGHIPGYLSGDDCNCDWDFFGLSWLWISHGNG